MTGFYRKVAIHGVEGGIKYEQHILVPAENAYPNTATLDKLMKAADEHFMQCIECGDRKRDPDDPDNRYCEDCEADHD